MLQGGAEEYASTTPWIAVFPEMAMARPLCTEMAGKCDSRTATAPATRATNLTARAKINVSMTQR